MVNRPADDNAASDRAEKPRDTQPEPSAPPEEPQQPREPSASENPAASPASEAGDGARQSPRPRQPRAQRPRQPRAQTAKTDAAPPEGGDGGDGAGPAEDGAPASGGAPRKRRRGRRGGRRHRKKPASGAPATGETPSDGEPQNVEASRPEATEAATGSPQTRQRSSTSASRRGGRTRSGQRRPAASTRTTRAAPAASDDADDVEEAAIREETLTAEQGAAEDRAEALAGMVGAEEAGSDETASPATAQARKRRRRGGRGRGKKKPAEANGETAATATEPAAEPKPRQQRPAAKRAETAPARGGSTRIAARQQRRQQRGPVRRKRLSEEEARALRGEAKTMLIHASHERTQIAVLEERVLIDLYVTRKESRTMVGNIYLGRVQNVIAGMEAAFVDLGRGRNAVLYAGEVQYSAEDLEGDQVPRIEKVLKSGQPVLVQVTKDPIGSKGARLTSQVSLAGRYLVLAPEQRLTGISRRLHENERARLRQILRDIRPEGHGVIVRTAAEGASKDALRRDLEHLVKQWDELKKKQKRAKAPALLYEEPELTMRVVRDIFSGDFERVVIDSKDIYDTVHEYLNETAPDMLDKVELSAGSLPMFEAFHVTEQIHKALERKVWLPSGGSIVIDRTEAMTVIDVNTGRFVGKGGSLEDTVFKNNLEAAEEVARQLRLRDIGGIIVIDFIDMLNLGNRAEVLRTLKRALARDKTRSQVSDEVSKLGLVEMTRKRSSEGLLEAFSEVCPQCEGRGIVLTHEID